MKIRIVTEDGGAISIRELRELIAADRIEESRYNAMWTCTCCGAGLNPGKVYDGGAGRRLCPKCAKAEGAKKRLHHPYA